MDIKEKLTKINYNPMTNKKNEFIVIHYVGAVSTAKNNADYFQNEDRGASANYFVDENDIYRVVKDTDKAWHVGGADKYYNNCRNSNSIGIEMCCYKNGEKLDVKKSVINRTVELTKELMNKYNIPAENVVRHYDVTHKKCPAPFLDDEARWSDFKAKLGASDGNISIPKEEPQENETMGIIAKIQSTLNSRYGLSIAVDNIYGTETKKAMVKGLQTELNTQFGRGIAVDGIFGTNTYNACVNVRKGAEGNITYLIQSMLVCRSFDIGVDGIFGSATESAVRDFQKQSGIAVDGIVGKNTFQKLFK